MNKNFKDIILKRLHEILLEIGRANDTELDKIGMELADIEKKLLAYRSERGE
jgi:hypothetical protein